MSHTNKRIEAETARCTRATAIRGFLLESRSSGHTVKPMSMAPSPKHVKQTPAATMRHARSHPPPERSRAAPDSFNRVRSLYLDQEVAPAEVGAQAQGLLVDRE